ncbi:Glycine/D-amino acid oxidase [Nocardioides alpinus]|uniref:FAD-dependent oxidoreductase n=1 Tax=Nocardioides alpinus TaxID=748909 RepID=A0A1I0ZFZ6_9ACTN|nr:FAD-dependent oxidoreductase [Nocardioides alpinus]PKH40621.1 FAD-dependent oxidoreductase [Nocardioides alpinus]SFB24292.1 Glycine/D-amino acid oxidase [Nocardioides alpinus]
MAAHRTAYERHAPDPRLVERSLAGSAQAVFWLEDLGATTPHPELTASTTADLTIVGGGYLGLWSAVHAKRRDPGRRVVLLEAHTLGWAASGRNGGFVDASLTHGEDNGRSRWPEEYDVLARLGAENLDGFEADVRELGLDCQWERTGMLSVAVEEHQVAWLHDEPDALDRAQVRAEVDSPLFLAGRQDADGCALVHPARLARELARVAADLGVEIHEHTAVTGLRRSRSGGASGAVEVLTDRATLTSEHVVLATNVFPSLLRRNRLMTVPVYDYVLMTEPLSPHQLASIGWAGRQGLGDLAHQFHYARLSADHRILWGGYDAVYPAGGRVSVRHEDRPESHARLASHFLATFPQLEDVMFTHRWAGAIDTCTQFTAFYGLTHGGRVAHATGFTGLGVAATRFAGEVLLDLLAGAPTERTELRMVRERPLPFPPEPLASVGINLTRWSLDRADHREGRRNAYLRVLDAAGLGFDS